MSDHELDLIYKRYKQLTTEIKDSDTYADEYALYLIERFKAGLARDQRGRVIRKVAHLKNTIHNLYEEKARKKDVSTRLETFMAQIRMIHEMKKIKLEDVFNERDPIYPNEVPDELYEEDRYDKTQPEEI